MAFSSERISGRERKPMEEWSLFLPFFFFLFFTMKDVERELSTRHGWQLPERAAIQPQHRKHLAVYRKCLMKARRACADSVTGDDFSWFLSFLTTGRHSTDMSNASDADCVIHFLWVFLWNISQTGLQKNVDRWPLAAVSGAKSVS